MDKEPAKIFQPSGEHCFERLRLARFGEMVTCVHWGGDVVINRGTTEEDAQQYWCENFETYRSDYTDTIFGQHLFKIDQLFYMG